MSGPQTTQPGQSHARGVAWTVMFCATGTSVTYNIFHVVTRDHMNIWLALLFGIIPPGIAMGLSHIVIHKSGWLKALTFVVMLGSMALSIAAVAAVVHSKAEPWQGWLFGGVLDSAGILSLAVILSGPEKAADVAPAEPARVAPARAAKGPAGGATQGPLTGATGGPSGGAIQGPPARAIQGPAAGATGRPATAPRARAAGVSMDADAIDARREYRASVERGEPLTDRKLAAKYPGRGRNWGTARIRECNEGPHLAQAQ
jgi:hypothetical protein